MKNSLFGSKIGICVYVEIWDTDLVHDFYGSGSVNYIAHNHFIDILHIL